VSELVTGDAVVLGLRPAKVPSRALAVCLDLLLVWAVYLVLSLGMLLAVSDLDAAVLAAVQIGLFLLVLVGAPIAVETLSRGKSLGKLACGLRVVREDGGPIRFRHALVRGALGVVEILMTFGILACVASLVSERGRRLGDVFAGTLVVRERMPTARVAETVPAGPPWLAGRFAQLDLSRVPDALWLAVRQYLTRAGQLDPVVGGRLAARLAGDLAACTGAPVPSDVWPADYLAAVVAERQARDAQRAFGGYGTPVPAGPVGPVMPPPAPSIPPVPPAPTRPAQPVKQEAPAPRRNGFVPPA
jgi:uncharacterized RDD family membrane protein YckC